MANFKESIGNLVGLISFDHLQTIIKLPFIPGGKIFVNNREPLPEQRLDGLIVISNKLGYFIIVYDIGSSVKRSDNIYITVDGDNINLTNPQV